MSVKPPDFTRCRRASLLTLDLHEFEAAAAGASLVEAAGLVVGKLGTASVTPVGLREAVRQRGE